jgi:hypothetical protein
MSRLPTQVDECLRHIMHRHEMQSLAIPAIYYTAVGIADPNGICQYVGKN